MNLFKQSITTAFILSAFLLSACDNNKNQSVSPRSFSLEENEGDFGSLNFNDKSSKVFVLKNNTTSAMSVAPTIEGPGAASFRLVSTRGCPSMAPKGSCFITVSVDAKGLSAGAHTASLVIAPFTSLALNLVVLATPEPVIEVQVNGNVVESIDFEVLGKQTVYKVVALRNIGPVAASTAPFSSTSADVIITSNGCPASLLPSKVCHIRLATQGKNIDSVIEGSISLGSVEIPLNLETTAEVGSGNLTVNQTEVDLGNFSADGQKKVEVISLTNSGNAVANLNLDSLPSGFV